MSEAFAFKDDRRPLSESRGSEFDIYEPSELGKIGREVCEAVGAHVELGERGDLAEGRRQVGELISGHVEGLQGAKFE